MKLPDTISIADEQAEIASQLYQLNGTAEIIKNNSTITEKHEAALKMIEEVAGGINKTIVTAFKKTYR